MDKSTTIFKILFGLSITFELIVYMYVISSATILAAWDSQQRLLNT